jgi:hypothetical protein
MPTVTTSVLVGSRPDVPATTLTVVANAVSTDLPFVSDDYYLDHPTAGLSLRAAMVALLDTHAELATTTVTITRSLRVRMSNAVAFSVDWGADTTLRDLLGYTGNLASATSHLAPSTSPLLWSAGRTYSFTDALDGTDGLLTKDTYAGRSGPGQVVATEHNRWFENAFRWRYVAVGRVVTSPATNGTYSLFWDRVLSLYRRFWVARNRTEDSTDDTTSLALTGSYLPSSGAYMLRQQGGPTQDTYTRTIERLDLYGDITLPVETAAEYT